MVFRGSRVCASERGHSVLMFPVLGSSVATQRPAVRAHPSCWFIHATSCPHLCPRYLGHRCGHVVVDKPAEIRPRRGRRHRNWMYPRGVYRNRWSRASVHIVMSNSPNHACSISNGARRIPPLAYSPGRFSLSSLPPRATTPLQ